MDEERLELLGQIAVWYYEDGLDQTIIADRIGKSRSMVSRMLNEVRSEGIVEFRVNYPLRRDTRLEQELERLYGLDQAWVLGSRLEGDTESRMRILGKLGARCLESRLFDGICIGVGLGEAVHEVIRAMPTLELREASIVQLIGSLSDRHPSIDSSELTRLLANKLSADYRYLPSPAVVNTREAAESLRKEHSIRAALEFAQNVDVALIGIGSAENELSSLYHGGFISSEELKEVRDVGAVGDILYRFIDRNGQLVRHPQDRHVISVPLETLHLVPSVIAVAGNPGKADAVRAAIRGGHLNVLVTDGNTANVLIAMQRGNTG
ncbi:MAG: sugar-binding transcriptional regulator [Alkalispirochaeta sp.]